MEKGLLRQAVKGLLPGKILWRKKSPYPKTHDPAYLELVRSRLEAVLLDPSAPIHGLIDAQALRSLMEQDDTWPWYGQLMRTPQTIAYFLQVNHWLKTYRVDIQL